jgi:hypothetical protein
MLAAVLMAGIGFQIYRLALQPIHSTDFRYIWLAGDMWKEGINPYSENYASRSEVLFGAENKLSAWVYPFQWYLISVPLSLFDLRVALSIWQIASVILTVLLIILSFWTAKIEGVVKSKYEVLPLATLAATFTPLTAVLQLGQPVILPIFGFALLLYGSVRRQSAFQLLGVVLLALKPQFGLPVMFMLIGTRKGLILCMAGGLATAVLAVPPLLVVSGPDQIFGLINNIVGGYDDVAVNLPISMIGLPSLMVRTTGYGMPISTGLLVACAASFSMSIVIYTSNKFNRCDKLIFAFGFSAICVSFFVGVHPSDLAILVVYLPFIMRQHRPYRIVSLLGFLVLWRFENLSRLFEMNVSAPSIAIANVGVLLIGVGWMLDFAHRMYSTDLRCRAENPETT